MSSLYIFQTLAFRVCCIVLLVLGDKLYLVANFLKCMLLLTTVINVSCEFVLQKLDSKINYDVLDELFNDSVC